MYVDLGKCSVVVICTDLYVLSLIHHLEICHIHMYMDLPASRLPDQKRMECTGNWFFLGE